MKKMLVICKRNAFTCKEAYELWVKCNELSMDAESPEFKEAIDKYEKHLPHEFDYFEEWLGEYFNKK